MPEIDCHLIQVAEVIWHLTTGYRYSVTIRPQHYINPLIKQILLVSLTPRPLLLGRKSFPFPTHSIGDSVVSEPSERYGEQRNIRPLVCLLSSAINGQDTEIFGFFVFDDLYQSYSYYAIFLRYGYFDTLYFRGLVLLTSSGFSP